MTANVNQEYQALGSPPSTPASGKWKLFPKADGFYQLDDAAAALRLLTTADIPGGGGVGDLVGPASATDNAIARYDSTTGKLLQDSAVTVDDSGNVGMGDAELRRAKLRDYSETVHTEAASGATETIDLETANVKDLTLTANCTLTFSNPPASGSAGSFTLIVRQDATGSRTLTYPASVKWAGGTPPTLSTAASAVDILTFMTVNGGTVWFGFLAGLAFA